MSDGRTFHNVYVTAQADTGTLFMKSEGIVWKSKKSEKTVKVPADEIQGAHWGRVSRHYMLKLAVQGGSTVRFDGFSDKDREGVASFLKDSYSTSIEPIDQSSRGVNWGDVKFEGSALAFYDEDKLAFDVPLGDMSQCVTNKNEVAIEFYQDDTAKSTGADVLCEIRLFMPDADDVDGDKNRAELFRETVVEKAGISAHAGQAIVIMKGMPFPVPRATFELEMYQSYFEMHGKTNTYKILYKNIQKLFVLPKPDGIHVAFCIALDQPLRQGQTLYPYLIMQVPKEEEMSLTMNLSEEEIEEAYPGKNLSPILEGPTHAVVTTIFKALTDKKAIGPGSYRTAAGVCGIRCTQKAADGWLYPLERAFFFVNKPVQHIRHEDISRIEFNRVDTSASVTKNFDVTLHLKVGGNVQFTNLAREEFSPLIKHIKDKGLKIMNLEKIENPMDTMQMDDDDDEDEDDDFEGGEESDDDEEDDDEEDEDEDFSEEETKKKKKSSSKSSKRKKDKSSDKKKKSKKSKKEKKSKKDKKKRKRDESESDEDSDE